MFRLNKINLFDANLTFNLFFWKNEKLCFFRAWSHSVGLALTSLNISWLKSIESCLTISSSYSWAGNLFFSKFFNNKVFYSFFFWFSFLTLSIEHPMAVLGIIHGRMEEAKRAATSKKGILLRPDINYLFHMPFGLEPVSIGNVSFT